MQLTTKFRYGTRALLDLAIHATEKPASIRDIARRQAISPKYLETLFSFLRPSGMVHSTRGAQGGYQLAADPSEITLKRIYELFEDPGCPVEWTTDSASSESPEIYATCEIWSKLYERCSDFLASVSLKDLMDRAAEKKPAANNYHI